MTRSRPAALSAARLLREQRAVGRQREVDVGSSREHRDQALEVAAQQRLAAGQPDLLDAEADEDAREARDLLEREDRARAAGTR